MSELLFSLNRTCLPQGDLNAFMSLTKGADVSAVEVRNDIKGQEFLNGMPARELKAHLSDAQIKVASVNALQRFNDWTDERAVEARALIGYAAALGAPGLVLCPAHEPGDAWDDPVRHAKLREGLKNLQPILSDNGVKGYVEPLGMSHSTMKKQADAVAAVDAIDGWDEYALCYDTFQAFRCGDDRLFLDRVALIHISGIDRGDLPPDQLQEPDRGLVFATDRVGNIARLKQALAYGYKGYVSIEPFSPETQRHPALLDQLRQSIRFIETAVRRPGPE